MVIDFWLSKVPCPHSTKKVVLGSVEDFGGHTCTVYGVRCAIVSKYAQYLTKSIFLILI